MFRIPKHIGIIPDGNRRWAKQNGMKKQDGYAHGVEPGLKVLRLAKKYGVEEINRVGEIFDSKLEQAMVAESHPDQPDEVVLEVLQKGYKLKERVIRPASVKINQI